MSLHVYTTEADMYRASLAELGAAYRRHLGRHYVATALFEVAGLFDPAAKVELVGIAVVPTRRRSTHEHHPEPLDFLDLDHLLSEEERLIRDTHSFVADRILPEVAGWFERGELPRELAKELGDLGLLGMHLEGYGCAGTNAVSYGLACLELEAGDSGARSFVSVQGSLAMFPIWRYGSEEQKRRWLPPWPPARWSAASA